MVMFLASPHVELNVKQLLQKSGCIWVLGKQIHLYLLLHLRLPHNKMYSIHSKGNNYYEVKLLLRFVYGKKNRKKIKG